MLYVYTLEPGIHKLLPCVAMEMSNTSFIVNMINIGENTHDITLVKVESLMKVICMLQI